MSENEGSETPLSKGTPWFNRPEADRIALIANGLQNKTIQMGLDFFAPLSTGFKTETPKIDPIYENYARELREKFETRLKDYLGRYKEAFELEAVMDGPRCYIFPENYKDSPKPKSFVDIESLFFYLGKNEQEMIGFLNEFNNHRGGRLSGGNYIVAGQLLARELGKEVKVSSAVVRDDGVIIGTKPETTSFPPNHDYKSPNYNILGSEKIDDTTFIVNDPQEKG